MKTTFYLSLLFSFLVLNSCYDDEFQIPSESKDSFQKRIVSFAEMKAKLKTKNIEPLGILPDVANKGKEDYIQAIDSTYIIEYSNDSLITYTIKVNTLDDEYYEFSNLVIKIENNKTEKFILHYNPSDEWMYNFLNYGTYDNYEGELQLTDTQGRATQSDCHIVVYPIVENDCGFHGGDEVVGYIIRVHCTAGGGTSAPGGSTPTGPNPGGFPPFDGDPGNGGGNSAFAAFLTLLSNVSQDAHDWFISPENSGVLTQIYNYLESNYHSDASIDFALWVIDFLMENPQTVQRENIIQRIHALEQYLYDNPYSLLDIPCDQIPQWQEVAQHQVPQSVKNKLQNLDNTQTSPYYGWALQSIEEANGSLVNNDYFAVTFTTMPYKPFPNQNQQFTPEEFLRFVRITINNFVNTDYSHFSPSTITGYNETMIWNSNNPVEAIIHINIPGNDGSVITSEHQVNYNDFGGFNNANWMFTTIKTPWAYFTGGLDGPHPVSGHREFGLMRNANGSYTIYTRGVDRFQFESDALIAATLSDGNPFESPDNLWASFQTKIEEYIQNNSYGNTVTVNTPVTWRPNWDGIKNVLIYNQPLSTLECN